MERENRVAIAAMDAPLIFAVVGEVVVVRRQ